MTQKLNFKNKDTLVSRSLLKDLLDRLVHREPLELELSTKKPSELFDFFTRCIYFDLCLVYRYGHVWD